MATIIDGKKIAQTIKDEVARDVVALNGRGIIPGLAVIMVGEDQASRVYVKNKCAACAETRIKSFCHNLDESTSEPEVLKLISGLNGDPQVHGILVQLPLPGHIVQQHVFCAIDPEKDVDGFHPCNVGRLSLGQGCLKPCTPAAVMKLIKAAGCDPKSRHAVVIGRSNIVGKPVALLLLEADATVTICHRATMDLATEVRRADIVVAAAGKAGLVRGEWIKEGAVVIDVGINRLADGRLVGDVEFDEAAKRAGAITPVPGGVGPMTVAMLLKNTIEAAKGLYPHSPDCPIRKSYA